MKLPQYICLIVPFFLTFFKGKKPEKYKFLRPRFKAHKAGSTPIRRENRRIKPVPNAGFWNKSRKNRGFTGQRLEKPAAKCPANGARHAYT